MSPIDFTRRCRFLADGEALASAWPVPGPPGAALAVERGGSLSPELLRSLSAPSCLPAAGALCRGGPADGDDMAEGEGPGDADWHGKEDADEEPFSEDEEGEARLVLRWEWGWGWWLTSWWWRLSLSRITTWWPCPPCGLRARLCPYCPCPWGKSLGGSRGTSGCMWCRKSCVASSEEVGSRRWWLCEDDLPEPRPSARVSEP